MEGASIEDPLTCGIIPRMVQTLFAKIQASPDTIDFTIKVSMVEIYLERIRDLLDASRDNLEVRAVCA
jgi:kinesin family protein 5